MQLTLALSILLAQVFLAVNASPLLRRNSKLLSLPLRRYEHATDLPAQLKLQQHINRGLHRLARMTGGEVPSRRELEENLERRVLAVEGPEGFERRFNRRAPIDESDEVDLEKRYNRIGVPKPASPQGNTLAAVKGGKGQAAVQKTPVAAANAPTADNSLGLDIQAQDTSYLATIQIGTPPRDFSILMDSGSADFWVGSEACQSQNGGGCGNHLFLGTQSSSSFVDSGDQFQVTYGTGAVQGTIIQDDISIAGLALKGHTFGVADVESQQFSSNAVPFDGLMGLAQSTLSEQQTLTPPEALTKAGLTQSSVVAYKISRLEDNKNDGEITFGGLDATKFDLKTLTTVPNVSKKGFWEANLDAVTVDGQDLALQGRTAILDTGTTLAVLPENDAIAIHKLIPGAQSDGQGGFTVPCNSKTVVALIFGGRSFAIDPRDIAFQPLNPRDPTGDCVSGIASGSVGGANEWLVGDTFLKNAYFVTDVEKNTVALAQLV
ncbi:aspartic peptidase A1 [Crepidotus variabilis]|uniref:Aspartic peptidase A1 n=1 Tax=Crepidotus variabilis TaxID=179855 RepID=A0A9P6JL01_9AGAR|nr:aspartic peptidase A1 [Crepidotus variabilis]